MGRLACSVRSGGAMWALVLVLVGAGGGCTTQTVGQLPDGGVDPDGGQQDRGSLWPDLTVADAPKPSGCTKHADCKGGYCVSGKCCPTKERVCGSACCAAGQTCFANACVVPGTLCYSSADCKQDEYCEPRLSPDGGAAKKDAGVAKDGQVCLKPTPSVGRCLKLPPRCPAGTTAPDGGTGDGGCLPACEVKPTVQAKLTAKVKWRWGPGSKTYPNHIDVWSTPMVARMVDTNCDGRVNELDPPNVVFVSSDVKETCCSCSNDKVSTCLDGVLRVLDGESGKEIWSMRQAVKGSVGFSGTAMVLGDVDKDRMVEILAVTGEGYIVQIGPNGKVEKQSNARIPEYTVSSFGWGGGLAVADMNRDGYPEVAYGRTVFTTKGSQITKWWTGTGGLGGGKNYALSTFVDLDGKPDGHLELLAGNTAYKSSGAILWQAASLSGSGLCGVGDFDGDGKPEVVHVASRKVTVLEGATGAVELGPVTVAGTSSEKGGPPTVADFDGDGKPEIGVAFRQYYRMFKPDYAKKTLTQVWAAENHDLSSSVTGSTVFDFEGDGKAEVIYNDECFLWVYDGKTGAVRFAHPTTSFTGTESSMVADVDGDGGAEMIMISNGASPTKWKCNVAPWTSADPKTGRPAWAPPTGEKAWRGLTVFESPSGNWVGTRTLWNQHTYQVCNICDSRDTACQPPNFYGLIPQYQKKNWLVPWLNNFRQNVQDKGIFDAPDPTVGIKVHCTSPIKLTAYVRNYGLALLPAGVEVGFYVVETATKETLLGKGKTTGALFPGQVAEVTITVGAGQQASLQDFFRARILIDPKNPTFRECRPENNVSPPVKANCLQ